MKKIITLEFCMCGVLVSPVAEACDNCGNDLAVPEHKIKGEFERAAALKLLENTHMLDDYDEEKE